MCSSVILGSIFPLLASIAMLHISIPLTSVRSSIFELNSVSFFQLRFIDLFMHSCILSIIIVLAICVEQLVIIIHVLSIMLRVHIIQLSSNSLSSDHSSYPSLQSDDHMDIPLEVLDIVWFECFVGLDLAIFAVVPFASCTI